MPRKSTVRSKVRFSFHTPELLVSLGVCCLLLTTVHHTLRDAALRPHIAFVQSYHAPERLPEPTHLSIPWNSDVAIEPGQIVEGKWGISEAAATYLAHSARPSEGGNIIIYGHNRREILGNIRAPTG